MKFLPKPLHQYADEMGIIGAIVTAVVGAAVAGGAIFGGPEAVDQLEGGPGIPPDLADHVSRGEGLERGALVGAAPDKTLPRPASFLTDKGIAYEWRGSVNWSARGIGNGIEAIVVHVTGPGTMAGMASWFNNPSSQVSAHFGIGKQGEVHQYVEVGDAAWHAGICNRWAVVANRWCLNHINPNRQTVGIELLLTPGETLEQYPAMATSLDELLGWLLGITGLEASRQTIIGHFEIDSVNRSVDPKCCLELATVVADVGGAMPQPPASTVYPYWDGTRWQFENKTSFDPGTGIWHNPDGEPEWGTCFSWKGRLNLRNFDDYHANTGFYDRDRGWWTTAPVC